MADDTHPFSVRRLGEPRDGQTTIVAPSPESAAKRYGRQAYAAHFAVNPTSAGPPRIYLIIDEKVFSVGLAGDVIEGAEQ